MRFDTGKGVISGVWVMGVREKIWDASPLGRAPELVEEGCDKRRGYSNVSNVPLSPTNLYKIS